MVQLSIIILSYNTKNLLRRCLASIYRKIKSVNFEIIVVENASYDGSLEMVKKEFTNVKLIKNDSNVGFSKGANIGAKKAKKQILLFLNSDIELLSDDFNKVIELLDKDGKAAVIGGLMENPDKTKQRSFGKFYNLFQVGLMLIGGDKAELPKNVSTEKEVDWVSGGFLFIRKEIFDKFGGFDEKFFMYLEDMELCYRIKKQGYKVLFYPNVKAMHASYASSSRSFAIIQIYKGIIYFYKKHKTTPEYLIVRGLLFSKAFVAFFLGMLTGNSYLTSTYRRALSV